MNTRQPSSRPPSSSSLARAVVGSIAAGALALGAVGAPLLADDREHLLGVERRVIGIEPAVAGVERGSVGRHGDSIRREVCNTKYFADGVVSTVISSPSHRSRTVGPWNPWIAR